MSATKNLHQEEEVVLHTEQEQVRIPLVVPSVRATSSVHASLMPTASSFFVVPELSAPSLAILEERSWDSLGCTLADQRCHKWLFWVSLWLTYSCFGAGPIFGCPGGGPIYSCPSDGPIYGCPSGGPIYGCHSGGPIYRCPDGGPIYG